MIDLLKSVAYHAWDAATLYRGVSRVVQGERVRLPPRWSRFYPPDYEPDTVTFLRQHCKPGDTVLDVGSHFGLISVLMARLVQPGGRVVVLSRRPRSAGSASGW